ARAARVPGVCSSPASPACRVGPEPGTGTAAMVPGGALPAAAACGDCGAGPELGTAAVRGGGAGYPLAARGRGAAAVTVAGVVVGLLAVAWMAVLCHARVRRLHPLHIPVDAAEAGRVSAVGRRG